MDAGLGECFSMYRMSNQLNCLYTLTAKFMGPTWGPPGSCRPHVGLMNLAGYITSDLLYDMYPTGACSTNHVQCVRGHRTNTEQSRKYNTKNCNPFCVLVLLFSFSPTCQCADKAMYIVPSSARAHSGVTIMPDVHRHLGYKCLALWPFFYHFSFQHSVTYFARSTVKYIKISPYYDEFLWHFTRSISAVGVHPTTDGLKWQCYHHKWRHTASG